MTKATTILLYLMTLWVRKAGRAWQDFLFLTVSTLKLVVGLESLQFGTLGGGGLKGWIQLGFWL